MKRFLAGLATVIILSPLFANSAVVGDINQDGKIDLIESIYALQVASGAYPTIDDSCLLTGQGVWEAEKDYNLCDVVTFSEITYACANAHKSITGVNEPPDLAYWTILSIKGDTGPPGTVPTVTTSVGQTWMDRNLGAMRVATNSKDTYAYGSLYQWGRPSDGHQFRESTTTTTLSSIDQPGHDQFILNGVVTHDWRNPQNDDLWLTASSTNNPCPSGFRLPTYSEMQAEFLSWDSRDNAGAFNSELKLPAAGMRSRNDGTLYSIGERSSYWYNTASPSYPYARYMYVHSTGAGTSNTYRAIGCSVRCIKD